MTHAVCISYARSEEPHALMLHAFLCERLAESDIFMYSLTPVSQVDTPAHLRGVFDAAELAVAIVGAKYHLSPFCDWEKVTLTNRLADPNRHHTVAVRVIAGTECKGALHLAMRSANYEPGALPPHATRWKTFQEVRRFAHDLFRQLRDVRQRANLCCDLRHHRVRQPNTREQFVERNLGGLTALLGVVAPPAGPSGQHAQLQEAAQEGIRSSAVLLGYIQQIRVAGQIAKAFEELAALAAKDCDGPDSEAFRKLQQCANELLLKLARPSPTSTFSLGERERFMRHQRLDLKCTLLLRLQSYLRRHLRLSFPEYHFLEALTTLVLVDINRPQLPRTWSAMRATLHMYASEIAEGLSKEVWVAAHRLPPVGRDAGLSELREFRMAREQDIRRNDIWGTIDVNA